MSALPCWIDTHCHLDAPEFTHDAHAVRAAARAAGVMHCVLPAVAPDNFASVHALACQHGDSYALGIHPLYAERVPNDALDRLAHALAQQRPNPQLVAVGEIGLDFFVQGLDAMRQEHLLHAQLQLARHWQLPVLLHARRALDRLLKALRSTPVPGGIVHAFNGSLQQAHQFLDMGFKLGFGGAATFERAKHLRRLLRDLPLDALVLETDAPDMPPQWLYVAITQRGAGRLPVRNSPTQLPRIAAVVAEIRGIALPALASACFDNTQAALPALAQRCNTCRTIAP